jgi:hypothetical protein
VSLFGVWQDILVFGRCEPACSRACSIGQRAELSYDALWFGQIMATATTNLRHNYVIIEWRFEKLNLLS